MIKAITGQILLVTSLAFGILIPERGQFRAAETNDFLSQKIRIESLIESHIRSTIGDQLTNDEYFVHCSVLLPDGKSSAGKKIETSNVTLASLKVRKSVLQQILDLSLIHI